MTSGSDSLCTTTSTSQRHHWQSPLPLPACCRLLTSKTASEMPSMIWGTSGRSACTQTSHSGCAQRCPRHWVSTSWPAAVFGMETDDVPSAIALLAAQTDLNTLSQPALEEEAQTPAAMMPGGQWSPSAPTIIAIPSTTPMVTPAVGMSAPPLLTMMGPSRSVQIQGQAGPASEDHAVLQVCQLELDALSCASSLCEIIEQVEEGHVQPRIWDKYGPCKGHPPHPLWENIKVTVNWQERLYVQLEKEFAGKKDCFFDFFTH